METAKEFPEIPKDFKDLGVTPNPYEVPIKALVDNVNGDSLYVVYTMVGKQWHDERMSPLRCWERAKKQDVKTKCITVRIRKTSESKKKEKNEKEKTKTEG
uniref:Tudor domain-containing protein n=1 Tax=Caenorhabditis tropicalis TaxID=1561998 RepID=A0A1I7UXK1_9PELO